jgi:hypothetical protein
MEQTKHTPGPWHVGRYTPNATEITILTKDGAPVTPTWGPQFYKGTGIGSERYKATAALIAAAPDLLAALQALQRSNSAANWIKAREAIAKATGQQ